LLPDDGNKKERGHRTMTQITLKIDGMQCGMCESHMNDAVRAAFPVKKVTSSHSKGETVIVTEQDIPDEMLKSTIAKTGYELVSISRAPYEKKGLFGKLFERR
jgi:copper chaperone CopZ